MKALLARLLFPALALTQRLAPLTRLWAWSRLKRAVPGLPTDCVVLGSPELHGTRRIECGHGLYLYPGLYLETRNQALIQLGDRVVLSRGVHLVAYAGIRIGEGSMIGEYTSIRDANHRYGAALPLREAGHDSAAIEIGRDVWIGRGVVILPGVRIGDGAVVAANAVVNRDVAPGAVVGGVPARPLKRGKTQ